VKINLEDTQLSEVSQAQEKKNRDLNCVPNLKPKCIERESCGDLQSLGKEEEKSKKERVQVKGHKVSAEQRNTP